MPDTKENHLSTRIWVALRLYGSKPGGNEAALLAKTVLTAESTFKQVNFLFAALFEWCFLIPTVVV